MTCVIAEARSQAEPVSPIGEEYFSFFRQECRLRGLALAGVEFVHNAPPDLPGTLAALRDSNPDALAWLGSGGLFVSGALREALEKIDWDPPRIATTGSGTRRCP